MFQQKPGTPFSWPITLFSSCYKQADVLQYSKQKLSIVLEFLKSQFSVQPQRLPMVFQTRHMAPNCQFQFFPQHLLFKITGSYYRNSFTRFPMKMYKNVDIKVFWNRLVLSLLCSFFQYIFNNLRSKALLSSCV